MSTTHRRGPWSQAEDNYLISLVRSQGAMNWVRIASMIRSRSPKQCRERYHQNLKGSLNHEPISQEEGLQIERLVGEMGKRWAEIARRLDGRSDNAVKNWWNGSMNRRRRLHGRRRASSPMAANAFNEQHVEPQFARPARPTLDRTLMIDPKFNSYRRQTDLPLPSPAHSDRSHAESVDGAPSLVSDTGSMYSSISPRVAAAPGIELPPLHHQSSYMRDNRRPSLPMLHLPSSGAYFSELDGHAHSYSARSPQPYDTFSAATKIQPSSGAQLPSASRQTGPPFAPEQRHHMQRRDPMSHMLSTAPVQTQSLAYARPPFPEPLQSNRCESLQHSTLPPPPQPHSVPPTPIQLPPLQMSAPVSTSPLQTSPLSPPPATEQKDSRMNLSSLLG